MAETRASSRVVAHELITLPLTIWFGTSYDSAWQGDLSTRGEALMGESELYLYKRLFGVEYDADGGKVAE